MRHDVLNLDQDEAEKLARLLLLDVVPASSQSHQRDSHGDGARGQWQGHGQSSGAPWSGAEDHSWTGWQAPQPEHESTSARTWSGGGAAASATEASQGRSGRSSGIRVAGARRGAHGTSQTTSLASG
eukprot:3090520-Pyramimonas_sp.AAC.1